MYDHALRHAGDSAATATSSSRRLSVVDRARAHLIASKKSGENALFCNKVRCVRAMFVDSFDLCSVLLQLKLQHMMAGMRMSWEARSMHVVVAKVSSNGCALGQEHVSG